MNTSSLVEDILITTTTTAASNQEQIPCYLVNNVEPIEQCKFILTNNCLEKEATFDYVYLVYCELGYELKYVSIVLIAFLAIVLFLALSTVADEFLCPCLLSVSKNLKMSDSLAGVTLLAFGNGCPDIFASIAAASGDRSELIVGELLGAGIFCTSIVAGLIFIHSDFKLATRPILRDTSFYLLAVYLVWCFCDAREVTFYGSLSFIVIYVIYLIVALSGQAIHSRLLGEYAIAEQQQQQLQQLQALDTSQSQEVNENWFKWREESMRRKQKVILKKMPHFVEQNKQQQDKVESHHFKSMTIEQVQYGATTIIRLGSDSLAYAPGASKPPPCPTIKPLQLNNKNSISISSISSNISNCLSSCSGVTSKTKVLMKTNKRQLSELENLLVHINPVNWSHWRNKNLFWKLVTIVRAPLLFATILTVPVVDHEKELSNWCLFLNCLHCVTIPFILACSFSATTLKQQTDSVTITLIISLIIGSLLAFLVYKLSSTSTDKPPKIQPVFAYVGFLMSILWIYTLANEIIGLLKTVGILFSLTDTAIGLGILAWGNSLGDIVANTSLAEAGYPRMALGASIGAPLLNLLLGFGLSFTISMKPGEAIEIEYSPTITLLCVTLATILLSIMISTLFPAEKSKKNFGYLLIAGYGVYFVLAVCLEYKIIEF